MNANTSHPNFLDLTTGTVLRLRHAAGTRISVRSGCAWITQEGDTRDIVLTAGRHFLLDRHGLAVVQVLAGGSLRVDPPQQRTIDRIPMIESWRARHPELIRVMPVRAAAI